MKNKSNKKYIYNTELANTFIQDYGYRCIGTGFNAKSNRHYWIFDYYEVQPYYNKGE